MSSQLRAREVATRPAPGTGPPPLPDLGRPGELLAGTTGAGVYRSTDGGASWAASGQGLVNTAVAAAREDRGVFPAFTTRYTPDCPTGGWS